MDKNKSVYKYRSGGIDSNDIKDIFERDLKSLINDEFFAPTRNNLNDPCEGFISTDILMKDISKMLEIYPHAYSSMDDFKDKLTNTLGHSQTSGIYSLSKNHLDELLWAHYANSHKGFCIEYDLDILFKLNNEMVFNKKELLCFDINYEDNPYSLSADDMNNIKDTTTFMNKLLGYKSTKWNYEDEVRIISNQSGKINYDYRAVKSIYFGLKMEKEQENKIMEKLQGRGINYYKIRLKNNTYKFDTELVEDLYKTDKKYLYSISPIQNYAIWDIENDKYADYYLKVAEIVRREPYCNSIEIVIIDKEKSNLDNPIFLVQFLGNNSVKMNQYYTTKEIDTLYKEIDDIEI